MGSIMTVSIETSDTLAEWSRGKCVLLVNRGKCFPLPMVEGMKGTCKRAKTLPRGRVIFHRSVIMYERLKNERGLKIETLS